MRMSMSGSEPLFEELPSELVGGSVTARTGETVTAPTLSIGVAMGATVGVAVAPSTISVPVMVSVPAT
jgi:hypothetical protein